MSYPTFVSGQSAVHTNGGGTNTCAVSLPSAPTVGNLVVVLNAEGEFDDQTLPATMTATNFTFTRRTFLDVSSPTGRTSSIWTATVPASPGSTFTYTTATGSFDITLAVYEITNWVSFDVGSTGSSGSSSTMSDSLTPTASIDALLMANGTWRQGGNAVDTLQSPWSRGTSEDRNNSADQACVVAYLQVLGTTGSYTPTWTFSDGSHDWVATSISIKGPSGTAGTNPVPQMIFAC